jgi:CheY-like chemotaxis protein
MIETAWQGSTRGRVLVVDDYTDARLTMREALERVGYVVFEAAHGQQALHYLVSGALDAVDLIVLDLMMPVMDGWQFLRLASSYVGLRHIPVLIVSATSSGLNETKHRKIVGVLRFPYEMRELIETVDACLAR